MSLNRWPKCVLKGEKIMEEILRQDISQVQSSIVTLSVTAAALALLPVICVVWWRRRCGKSASFVPVFIGAAGFLVSARVLELGVHMVCIVWDNPVSRFINGSTPVYVLYGACMAGIFEECGRYVVIRFLMKKNKNRESMVMYGIGHGGAEVWAISLMSIVSLLAVAIMLQGQGIEGTLPFLGVTGDSPESMAGPVAAAISSAANFGAVSGVMAVLERMGAMAVHISLTVVVAYGIVKGQRRYLPLAILAHAAGDLLPALYQRGAVSILVTELWLWLWAILLMIWARKLYQKRWSPIF